MSENEKDLTAAIEFADDSPRVVPVAIGNTEYELHEATGDAACRYRNAVMKSMRLGPEGKPQIIDGIADSEPLLVSLCLRYKNGGPVPNTKVRGFPPRIIKALFARAKEISEIDEEEETVETLEKQIADLRERRDKLVAEDSAKNDLTGSEGGST